MALPLPSIEITQDRRLDPLTGLPPHEVYKEELRKMLAAQKLAANEEKALAVIVFSLDKHETLESLSPQAANDALKRLAGWMRGAATGEEAVLGRVDDNVLAAAILLPVKNSDRAAVKFTNNVRDALQKHCILCREKDGRLSIMSPGMIRAKEPRVLRGVTASAGISFFALSDDPQKPGVRRNAEAAYYYARVALEVACSPVGQGVDRHTPLSGVQTIATQEEAVRHAIALTKAETAAQARRVDRTKGAAAPGTPPARDSQGRPAGQPPAPV